MIRIIVTYIFHDTVLTLGQGPDSIILYLVIFSKQSLESQ